MTAIEKMRGMGVRDSKRVPVREREILFKRIVRLSERIKVIKIPPRKIDQYVLRRRRLERLNLLEAEAMAKVIGRLRASIAYIDSCDTDAERFGLTVGAMAGDGIQVHSSHRADENYPIVSAASIIAKVTRDKEISKLRRSLGDIGSGYPSDSRTRTFLATWLRREATIPEFARRSWRTWERLEARLDDFAQVS